MTDRNITIDPEACALDGLCVRVCPARILTAEPKQVPTVGDVDQCVLCGQCMAICPSEAIAHSRLEFRHFTRIRERRHDGGEVLDTLHQRRSVRAYRRKRVSKRELEEIARIAAYAPTGAHGGEAWVRRVVIVTGFENMEKVRDLTADYMTRLEGLMSGVMMKIAASFNEQARGGLHMLPDLQMRLAEREQGRDAITFEAPAALFVHAPRAAPVPQIDSDAAMMAMMLAAQASGLGTCWNGYMQKASCGFKVSGFTALKEFLKVPDHHEVFAACTIGFPAIRLHSVPQRETEIRWIG